MCLYLAGNKFASAAFGLIVGDEAWNLSQDKQFIRQFRIDLSCDYGYCLWHFPFKKFMQVNQEWKQKRDMLIYKKSSIK